MTLRLATMLCMAVWCSSWGLVLGGEKTDALADIAAEHAPLSDKDLGLQRARGSGDTLNTGDANSQLSNSSENAKLYNNSVNASTTGNNTVSNNAFAGASGFATVIQNSGNNVIIQNATIVNYSAHP